MAAVSPPSPVPGGTPSSPFHDDLSMQQSLFFSDSLKDLKNLRSQLYSAAEYFESSFTNDDQRQIVMDTLKDYAVQALVNTVDHLGSVSFKVNGLLDENVDEVMKTDVRVSCIEQRLHTCRDFINCAGISQQSLVFKTPKYHKRYKLPVGTTMPESGNLAVAHSPEAQQHQDPGYKSLHNVVRATMKDRTPSFRKMHSSSPSQRARSSSPSRKGRSPSPSRQGVAFVQERSSVAVERRSVASFPNPSSDQLTRSGSISKPGLLNSYMSARKFPLESHKSSSMNSHVEKQDDKDAIQTVSKGKRLLKALLSRRKTKKDETLYTYLDEY